MQLARSVPDKTAFYMLSAGKYLNANDALAAGLVSKLAESPQALENLVEETIEAIEATSR